MVLFSVSFTENSNIINNPQSTVKKNVKRKLKDCNFIKYVAK